MKPMQKPASVKTILAIPARQVVVRKDNVKQTVIKDGFQNLETIQKSLPKEKWPP
jgi:ABC-type xylose transport system substrate-binding protein